MQRTVAIGQPAVTVAEIADPTAAGAGIELIHQDAVQLQRTPFRARRVTVRLGTTAAVYHSTSLPVRTRTSAHEGLLGYVTFGPRAKGTVNGLRVRAGLMLAAEPEAEALLVVDADWESLTFLLRPQDLREHWITRRCESAFRLPHGVEMSLAKADSVRSLFDWGKRLVDAAVRQPALFDMQANKAAAEAELFETLLQALGTAESYEPARGEWTCQSHTLVVRAVEEYALSHQGEHLHVSELCRVAAASERTLENAFKQVLGLTPVTYLNRLRLHRVRQALLAANEGTTTVSAEALNWGFWHFGDFSRAYKDCFGELPSDTLRRKRGNPSL